MTSGCDIIIPVWNQPDHTERCLDHIVRNTKKSYRLIVIDNGSGPETKQYLEEFSSARGNEVTLIRNEENLGFVKAVNQGMRVSSAPYVCIMNNDTEPGPGWLGRMIDFAESHSDVGLVNPQCGGHGEMSIEAYAGTLASRKGEYMEMNQCQGFCMLVKRGLIDKIGFLDEAFGIGGYDDTDYSMRAHKAGSRSVAIGDAYVYHRLHTSFDASGDREEWVRRNRKIYYGKWGKHLRVGAVLSLRYPDKKLLSNTLRFVYGLAREWSWVHLWINFAGESPTIRKAIDDCLRDNGLPPHQNLRIDIFRLPGVLFKLVVAGKLAERLRGRMKDKRMDALVVFDERDGNFFSSIRSVVGFEIVRPAAYLGAKREGETDWQKLGVMAACDIKSKRGHNG